MVVYSRVKHLRLHILKGLCQRCASAKSGPRVSADSVSSSCFNRETRIAECWSRHHLLLSDQVSLLHAALTLHPAPLPSFPPHPLPHGFPTPLFCPMACALSTGGWTALLHLLLAHSPSLGGHRTPCLPVECSSNSERGVGQGVQLLL